MTIQNKQNKRPSKGAKGKTKRTAKASVGQVNQVKPSRPKAKRAAFKMTEKERSLRGRRWVAADIKETTEELREALLNCGNEASGLAAKRVRLLLLLKTGAAKSAHQASKKLGVVWATASRWLNIYREGGLDALLDIKQGGRTGLTPEQQRLVEAAGSVPEAVKALEQVGVTASPWTIYKYLQPKKGGEAWQCKTYVELDEAIERFAASPSAERVGQWYQRPSAGRDGTEFNNELLKYLLELGASAVLKGELGIRDLKPSRSWNAHQGAIGSHLGIWLPSNWQTDNSTGDLLDVVKGAARKLASPNRNQTLRILLEAGLTVAGYPPN